MPFIMSIKAFAIKLNALAIPFPASKIIFFVCSHASSHLPSRRLKIIPNTVLNISSIVPNWLWINSFVLASTLFIASNAPLYLFINCVIKDTAVFTTCPIALNISPTISRMGRKIGSIN